MHSAVFKHTCVPGFHQAPRRPRVTERPWVRGVESSPRLLGCAPQEGCPTDTCFQSSPSPLWACSCLWVGWEPSCPPGLFSTSMYEAWPGPWSPPSRAFLLCLSRLHPYVDLTAPQAGPPQSSSLRSPAGLPSESRLRTPCPSRVRGMPPADTVCSGGCTWPAPPLPRLLLPGTMVQIFGAYALPHPPGPLALQGGCCRRAPLSATPWLGGVGDRFPSGGAAGLGGLSPVTR